MKIRDHLAADAVAAGQRTDGDGVKTVIVYTDGKVSSVTLPAPTAGASQPAHTYSYPNTTTTKVNVAGLSPSQGYARQVTFWAPTSSMAGQITSDTDATGKTTHYSWHVPFEAPASVVDPAGMKTTWAYDGYRRTPSDVYGPAHEDCFTGLLPTTPATTCSAQPVPRTRLAYDGASTFSDGTATNSAVVNGPAVTYWDNYNLEGDPIGFATGVGSANGYLDANWGTGAPAALGAQTNTWSARFEGVVTFPTAGDYTFRLTADDGVRFWIDDVLYASGWSGTGSPWTSDTYTASANAKAHIRVDYYEVTGSASIKLEWDLPGGGTTWVPVALRPGSGLTTATSDPDGKVTATEYLGPETGQVSAQVADPAGLNLRTVTSYESSPGTLDPYKRPRSRTLPGASTSSTYTYYTSGDTVPTSGCSGVSTQTGFAKQYTGPGSTPVQTRSLVDSRGRVVASQHVGDAAWNCTTFDSRGRLTQAYDHAGGTIADNDYLTVANQVTTTSTDSYGRRRTTITTWDLLGRVISYQDEHGTVTRFVYDQAGRRTATYRQFLGQPETQLTALNYDYAGRLKILTEWASGTARQVYFSHDGYGRPSLISRPGSVTTEMWAITGSRVLRSMNLAFDDHRMSR